ncbi:hypothetical protein FA15DRAFT_705839 [Coprinopsis marcescibilis]|uniref:Uncharacterized protein n=1 Tax=Coprinopsis marcescibilis TaxID=230819 RepID=A0A5C3KS27_COPMA|nr:hypothetical protein FA15DRAFT_705839 [Coprinopsis marcescibilis]
MRLSFNLLSGAVAIAVASYTASATPVGFLPNAAVRPPPPYEGCPGRICL